MLAILDGAVLPAEEALIPATDEGLLRGDGVFEVVRLYDGRPFALEDHLARMERSAQNLRLPFDVEAVRADVAAVLEAGQPGDGLIRLVATRGGRRLGFLERLPDLPDAIALRTVRFAPTRILDGVKSLSYAPNMLASRVAQEQGADEALLVTPHGRVLEAPTSSFVCSLNGRSLVTPPLDDHILDSITRRRLLAVCDVDERPITFDDLRGVHEAFLCSTVREVLPVRAIDGRELPVAGGPLTAEAGGRVRARIQDELRAPAG
ncbi:MAG: branched-chain amino acid aminotransferase [Solirubrobacteraceae bacterium]|jgi:branched-chain amino acid aminotransferase|nr:branched-chain amino acid aminotransferase [Solirubrobacteraceae bacterium]